MLRADVTAPSNYLPAEDLDNWLKARGIMVKVNSIVLPGINDGHIPSVARRMSRLGADLFNCMPYYPNAGSEFEHLEEPDKATVQRIRKRAGEHVKQMRHCTRCRADAVGLLDDDKTDEMRGCLSACARLPKSAEAVRPYVAVATQEGVLVNQHLGEAVTFQIWGQDGEDGYKLIEERQAPPAGGGAQRWLNLSRILSDCQAVLVSDLGEGPKEALSKRGIKPVAMSGFIEKGLEAIYTGKDLALLQGRLRKCSSKQACAGGGTGCG